MNQFKKVITKNIGVVITTKDRPEELKRCLISIYNQTVIPGEVVVVVDGSETELEFSDLQVPDYIQLFLIVNSASCGVSKCRNIAIEKISTPYIAFLDDDDEFRPNKIEKIEKFLNECEVIPDLIYHEVNIFWKQQNFNYNSSSTGHKDYFSSLLIRNVVGGVSRVVCKRSALIKLHGFNEQLNSLEDWELWLRFAKNGGKLIHLKDVLSIYNINTKHSTLSTSLDAYQQSLNYIDKVYHPDVYLTKEKRLKRQEFILRDVLRANIIRQSYFEVVYCAFKLYSLRKDAKYFLLLVISLLGPNVLVYLYLLIKNAKLCYMSNR